ncbi:MAG: PEP-CTERM sorting domain-containing protein [Cyanobacteria bacterium J06642_11]
MENHRMGLAVAAAALFLVSDAPGAQAQLLDYSFTVDVFSGPLAGEQYVGNAAVDVSPLASERIDTSIPSLSIRLSLGGVEFTETQDVQDVDAQSPRANFSGGEFVGATYIVSRFGENPTNIPLIDGVPVDGFAIDNSEFGYVVGANFYQGMVNYRLSLPPEVSTAPIQSMPEPSLWLGLAIGGSSCWLIRRHNS